MVLDVRRAGRLTPFTIHFAAIREAREFISSVPGANSGMLFGTYSAEAIVIEHAAASPGPQTPVGFFRVQPGGWPALSETDLHKMKVLMPSGGLIVVLRTLTQRPWPATVYALDALQLDGHGPAIEPIAEFPFDEYLLRNGWLSDLAEPLPEPRTHSTLLGNRRLLTGLAVAGLVAVGAVGAYLWVPSPGRSPVTSRSASLLPDRPDPLPGNSDVAPLGLKLAPNSTNLELSWNRRADAIRSAAVGTVTLRNGPATRVLFLTSEQLREGRILFQPLTGADIDARLEVTSSTGRTEAESVQLVVGFNSTDPVKPPLYTAPPSLARQLTPDPALRSTPAPLPPLYTAPPPLARQITPDPALRSTPAPPPPLDPPPSAERADARPVLKPFHAESLTPPSRQQPTVLPAPAPETPTVAVPGPAAIPLSAISSTPAPPAPVKAGAAPPAANPAPPGGRLEEAQLISGRRPEFPRQALDARVTGTVEIEITIGTDGHVKSARATKGDPRLRTTALEAVKQWIYRPATLNGKTIESQRQIVVNFKE
jgi:periplasmic protein TonB